MPRQEVLAQFGARVRAARLGRGWTQEDLSGATGLATVQISRIERGVREIRLTTLLRLLGALEVPCAELLDDLSILDQPDRGDCQAGQDG